MNDEITIPVNISRVAGITISAISMTIRFDGTKLDALTFSNTNNLSNYPIFNLWTGLETATANVNNRNTVNANIRLAWAEIEGIQPSGKLFDMKFKVKSVGSWGLSWDFTIPENNEYAYPSGAVIQPVEWIAGTISCGT